MTQALKPALVVAGWASILLGIVGLFLAAWTGIALLLIGLFILSSDNVWAHQLRQRFPQLAETATRAETNPDPGLRTGPHEGIQ